MRAGNGHVNKKTKGQFCGNPASVGPALSKFEKSVSIVAIFCKSLGVKHKGARANRPVSRDALAPNMLKTRQLHGQEGQNLSKTAQR
jgi:hypothetical protein